MAQKKRPTHQPFESTTQRGQFTKICKDMMDSEAWLALNLRQQGLYLLLKSKYRQKVVNNILVSSNRDDIAFPRSEINQSYGDYRTFKTDMEALKKYGFVRLAFSGKVTRTCDKYAFSDEWKKYIHRLPSTQKKVTD